MNFSREKKLAYLFFILCLVNQTFECSNSYTYCEDSTFSYFNFFQVIEGDVGLYFKGYLRAKHYHNVYPSINHCYYSGNYECYMFLKSSIGFHQMAYESPDDPKLNLTNRMFTLDYYPMPVGLDSTYTILVINSYDGCVISLQWIRDSSALYINRVVYTIKTHTDELHSRVTEWHAIHRVTSTYTSSIGSTNLRNNFYLPLRLSRYHYHPYHKTYFYIQAGRKDYDEFCNRIILTNYPAVSGTTLDTACTTNIDENGSPSFIAIGVTNWSYRYYEVVIDNLVFFGEYCLIREQYIYDSSSDYYIETLLRWKLNDVSTGSSSISRIIDYTGSTSRIYYLSVFQDNGVAFIRYYSGSTEKGILFYTLSDTASVVSSVRLDNSKYWKLKQTRIDQEGDRPIFAINSAEKHKIYRLTTILTQVYEAEDASSQNFYDYPVDVGRYSLAVAYPGDCDASLSSLTNADYANAHVVFFDITKYPITYHGCMNERNIGSCGNGWVDSTEECDDGDFESGNGCSSSCQIEDWWRCYNTPLETRSKCERTKCGNGILEEDSPEAETCDDGTQDNDNGCEFCVKQPYTWCSWPGVKCEHPCGDGKITSAKPGPPENLESYPDEICDDGNNSSGDGCSDDCLTVETGYECLTPGSPCTFLCGNGHRDTDNTLSSKKEDAVYSGRNVGCDDGSGGVKANNADCDSNCHVRKGYECHWGPWDQDEDYTQSSVCRLICGNGVEDDAITSFPNWSGNVAAEECDDGNNINGDGCSSGCTIEDARTCCFQTYHGGYLERELWIDESWDNDANSNCEACCHDSWVSKTNSLSLTDSTDWWLSDYGISEPALCYTGRFCDQCTKALFPGYPLEKIEWLPGISSFPTRPKLGTGKLLMMELVDERVLGIATIFYPYSIIHMVEINREGGAEVQGTATIQTSCEVSSSIELGKTRQTVGQFYIESTTSSLTEQTFYGLNKKSDGVYLEELHTTTKTVVDQVGSPYFIYWPHHGRLYSGQENLYVWDSYNFTTKEQKELLKNYASTGLNEAHQQIYLTGEMHEVEPVWTDPDIMYVAVKDLSSGSVVLMIKEVTMGDVYGAATQNRETNYLDLGSGTLQSMVSYAELDEGPYHVLIVGSFGISEIDTTTNPMTASTITISPTSSTWHLIQRKPRDENDDLHPIIYGFNEEEPQKLYGPLNYEANSGEWEFEKNEDDEYVYFELPKKEHWIEDPNFSTCSVGSTSGIGTCQGRFDLVNYPFAIGERFLVSYFPHSCNGYSKYRWDYYENISLNIADLIDGITYCYDNIQPLFDDWDPYPNS